MARIGTYFAIRSFPDALNAHSVDRLKDLLRLLTPDRLPTRKAELIAAIEERFAGDRLKAVWDRLDETQQLAIAETLYAPAVEFDAKKFRAKYGRRPEFGTARTDRGYGEAPTLLCLFLFSEDGAQTIPRDLAQRLHEFVPEPRPASLQSTDELPEHHQLTIKEYEWQQGDQGITVFAPGSVYRMPRQKPNVKVSTQSIPLVRRDTERDALIEVGNLLRLVDSGKLAVSDKTALPGTATVREIAAVLAGGDYYPAEAAKTPKADAIGPLKAYAWPLILQAGGLAELRGKKLALTKAGLAALGKPASETLRTLWQRWLKNKQFDEFNRIDTIKGQQGKGKRSMTAASGRRAMIAGAFGQCPLGAWIRFEDFSRHLVASGQDFEVTRQAWDLYICDAHYGSLGHSGFHDWNILQQRYLACLLFEYAATLGLIDVAYVEPWQVERDFSSLWGTDDLSFLSRYDGLLWFRVNTLGAYCMGLADTYDVPALAARTALTVLPSLQIKPVSGPLAVDEALFLENWAVQEDRENWRLDRVRILTSVELGRDIGELRDFLETRDTQGLPDTVAGFLAATERSATALKCTGPVLLIDCADPAIAETIAGHATTKGLCRRVGPQHLAIKVDAEDRFRKAVNGLGYGLPRT
jgi:hypothetical protein